MSHEELAEDRLRRGCCPHCGTELQSGYGMAGGGMGVYMYCPKETCGKYFDKTQTGDM